MRIKHRMDVRVTSCVANTKAYPKPMQITDLHALIQTLCAHPKETEWIEFKESNFHPDEIGQRISAIANSAMLEQQSCGFIVFGVHDKTHGILGTSIRLKNEKQGGEPFEHWISKMLNPKITLSFRSIDIDEKHVELIIIDPAYQRPVRFKNDAYIRIGEVTKRLVGFPEREATLWNITSKFHFEDSIAAYHQTERDLLENYHSESLYKSLYHEPATGRAAIRKLEMAGFIKDDLQGGFDVTNLFAILATKKFSSVPSISSKAPRVIVYKGANKLEGRSDVTGELGYAISFQRLLTYIKERTSGRNEDGRSRHSL